MKLFLASIPLLASLTAPAQTNLVATNQNAAPVAAVPANAAFVAQETERIRQECVNNRRIICGRVLQIVPDGLIVESGYGDLLKPPAHQSWVLPSTMTVTRDPNAMEAREPDSLCIGVVFLTDIPKRPQVNRYDYVVLNGYPAGGYDYVPLPGIHKPIRRFAAGVERAVALNLEAREKQNPKVE